MLNKMPLRRGVLAVALSGLVAGVAGAQIITPGPPRVPPQAVKDYCTSGPFSLTAGGVRVHIGVDDVQSGPTARVVMRLYDADGTVVASRTATIAAGHTETLEYEGAEGRFELLRAQAEVTDTRPTSSRRRRTVGHVELNVDSFAIPIPVDCAPGDTYGPGR